MPSPRAAYGRDYTAVSLQFDPRARHLTERQRNRVKIGQGRKDGMPVTVRNGLPFKPHRLPGLVFPGCGCINRESGERVIGCQIHPLGDDDA